MSSSFSSSSKKRIQTDFHREYSFEKRVEESTRILKKYPNRIPVIVQRIKNNTDIPDIDKKKYLVPNDLTIGHFIYIIRKRIKLEPVQAIFIYINNIIPPTSSLISQLYKEQKDDDGFLYIEFSGESTFG
jgi:GABA(A) receptor-associated protein